MVLTGNRDGMKTKASLRARFLDVAAAVSAAISGEHTPLAYGDGILAIANFAAAVVSAAVL